MREVIGPLHASVSGRKVNILPARPSVRSPECLGRSRCNEQREGSAMLTAAEESTGSGGNDDTGGGADQGTTD